MDLDWIKILTLVLGSGVLSALLTSFFGKLQNDKNIKIENITKERRDWRDKIRNLTKEVNEKFYDNKFEKIKPLISDFETRLNPIDKNNEDQKIINTLYLISKLESQKEEKINEFNKRIALLLKHDWERVKKEVKLEESEDVARTKYTEMLTKQSSQ